MQSSEANDYGRPPEITIESALTAETLGMRMLLRAIFQKSCADLLSNSRRVREEAEYWFQLEDLEWPFSFLMFCDAFHLNPQATREQVLRQRRLLKFRKEVKHTPVDDVMRDAIRDEFDYVEAKAEPELEYL